MTSPKWAKVVRLWIGPRLSALLALALPCLASLAYLAIFDAPPSYLVINSAALAGGLFWIGVGRIPESLPVRRAITVALIALLAVPLVTGPDIHGISRWIPLGGLHLHAGMIAIPSLACLAARDRDYAPPIILTAILMCLVQPDAASAFALTGAAVGLYLAWSEWKPGLVAIIGFFAALFAHVRGVIPPEPFVERVLAELAMTSPLVALTMLATMIASFLLMLRVIDQGAPERYALAGTLAGFSLAGMISSYPSILIGYGASPIIGFALALGMARRERG
ncbi:hypothetical protein [Altererythrobacter sp. MF3-039]|uniref:hypothetical protein n=1 Tax=Altererythrobacter sp. MF3-039 TaxID=3252901 RepID=UPI00390C63F3